MAFTLTITFPSFTNTNIMYILAVFSVLSLMQFIVHKYNKRYNSKSLKGKHVWLVGSTRGIGRATAHLLYLSRKSKLILSSRDEQSLISLQQTLYTLNNESTHKQASKQSQQNEKEKEEQNIQIQPLDIRSSFDVLHSSLPTKLDVLILNAGINQRDLHFNCTPPQLIDDIINTNLKASIRLIHLCLPQLIASKGSIVIVSSLAAYRGLPGASVYSASKAALTTFAQAIAVELQQYDVDVICTHPGFVDTPAIKGLKHPKCFVMRDVDAAEQILRAVEDRNCHVGFPWFMEHVVMRFAKALPTSLYNFILTRTLTKQKSN